DYLFIDGDHTYEGVKADYERYRPLVRPGGKIVFHDVVEHRSSACQVDRFWRELRETVSYREYINSADQGKFGIGLVQA
ncbi:MAG: class I SAM-dependent methyltransferase, partial [Flavobacteriales bacterium]